MDAWPNGREAQWTRGTSRADLAAVGGRVRMEKSVIELLARRAGLAKALAEFPEDVAVAAKQAESAVAKVKKSADPRAEPWPPMRAGSGL